MAEHYLGIPVDLHGGGLDLVYPHHYDENEIAFALGGQPFSRIFLHLGLVRQNESKMSKSTGNLGAPPRSDCGDGASALRWYLLQVPHQQGLDWNAADVVRARQEYSTVSLRCRSSIAAGAGGSLQLSELQRVVRDVRHAFENGFEVHRAIDRLKEWNTTIERAGFARFGRGELRRARGLYELLGAADRDFPDHAGRRSTITLSPLPPPMHRVARPSCESVRTSSWTSVTTIRAPLAPIGWPSATAPPWTLNCRSVNPKVRWTTTDAEANASLCSTRSKSAGVKPVFSRCRADRGDR